MIASSTVTEPFVFTEHLATQHQQQDLNLNEQWEFGLPVKEDDPSRPNQEKLRSAYSVLLACSSLELFLKTAQKYVESVTVINLNPQLRGWNAWYSHMDRTTGQKNSNF